MWLFVLLQNCYFEEVIEGGKMGAGWHSPLLIILIIITIYLHGFYPFFTNIMLYNFSRLSCKSILTQKYRISIPTRVSSPARRIRSFLSFWLFLFSVTISTLFSLVVFRLKVCCYKCKFKFKIKWLKEVTRMLMAMPSTVWHLVQPNNNFWRTCK